MKSIMYKVSDSMKDAENKGSEDDTNKHLLYKRDNSEERCNHCYRYLYIGNHDMMLCVEDKKYGYQYMMFGYQSIWYGVASKKYCYQYIELGDGDKKYGDEDMMFGDDNKLYGYQYMMLGDEDIMFGGKRMMFGMNDLFHLKCGVDIQYLTKNL